MKLCVFSILASFVPRTLSSIFALPPLSGHFRSVGSPGALTALPVAEAGHRGRVLDVRHNGYELHLEALPNPRGGAPDCFRPLLINREKKTALVAFPPSEFHLSGSSFYSTFLNPPDSQNVMQWMAYVRSATNDAKDPEYVEDLYL
ncbi:hypothetical protein Q9L58_008100 [Maublancomyces gigas]|uniref:Uncharacterized protein n=1 Tax=Discina gigas TaxID=1032678 RepID=A0ABR3GAL2_9PEZI